ncbi:hypothetical protein OSG_eHP7_00030 [environmental Halophage eHP-7]|nr:hypothetical protein OSG_eHP7_00030 [environmental Halophage eHP-7]
MPAQSIQRIIIYSLNSGNILDVPGHRLGATQMPEVEEERVQTAAGTSRARQRTHRLSVQLRGEEEIQLARIMEDGCPVRALALGERGTRQIVFNAPARLQRTATAAGPLGDGVQDVILETTLFNADVSASTNLVAGVPFAGASSERAPLIAELGTTSVGVTAPRDLATRIDGTVVAVTGTDEVLEHDTGNVIFQDSNNLNFARGISQRDATGNYNVLNVTSGGEKEVVNFDPQGGFLGKQTPPPNIDDYLSIIGSENYSYDANAEEVVQFDGGTITQTFPAPSTAPITGLTIDDTTNEERLYIAVNNNLIHEMDISGAASDPPTLIRNIDDPDVVFGLDSFYKRLELVDDIAAITWTGEVLRVQDTNETSAQRYSLHGLSLRGEAPQERSFRVDANTAIPIQPQTRVSAKLRMPFPAGGARIEYPFSPPLTINALAYDGSVISSDIGFLTLPENTWIVEIDNASGEAVFNDIEIVVTDPGRALGARRGGVAQACDQRIPEPEWAK